eukprot:CAMPEP_0194773872 /NCGR_PEP_ID=MMETSP0323_2-20130528/56076_1 /TAXON_ID=2866 ORGANISM="Crypthecodinium cohnii, Strain Seligo" /NCGR_SAMPLE_ID=MMETSP0323_2 /ASSEMBLY_ACC=CAM_ASM_000346 /LENGTH=63 /DNA_ID=CAMNT_0039709133 /DNA_START=19 /DNA_END=210 /DNA_ORIENTATION=-
MKLSQFALHLGTAGQSASGRPLQPFFPRQIEDFLLFGVVIVAAVAAVVAVVALAAGAAGDFEV